MYSWWKRGLIALILVALAAAGYNALQRWELESENRGIETAVVYGEAKQLVSLAGDATTAGLLDKLQDRGVTTVLFKEDTPQSLKERGEFHTGTAAEMNGFYGLEKQLPAGEYRPGDTYLVTGDRKAWERVAGYMEAKGIEHSTAELNGGGPGYVISTPLSGEALEEEGLGFPLEKMRQVAREGFNIMVQVRNWHGVTRGQIEEVFARLGEVPRLSGVLFNDRRLPGYVNSSEKNVLLRALGEEIEKLGVPVVAIEFEDQMGFGSVARSTGKQVARLHTIPGDEMENYGVGSAVDRYELSATDRNIRVLLVRFFTGSEHPDLMARNMQLFEQLQHTLVERHGFSPGQASIPGSLDMSRWSILLIGLGVAAGGALLVLHFFPGRWGFLLGVLGFLGWLGLMGMTVLDGSLVVTARKLGALAAAIIFPSLAVTRGIREQGSRAGPALLRFLQVTLVSLLGASFMTGFLAGTGFMLKLDQFAGVKMAMGLPLLLAAGYFFFRVPSGEGPAEKLARTARHPLTVGLAGAAALIGAMLLLYMARTGNEGMVLPFEQAFRGFLEDTFAARPRTKEFLLGHPLLILLLYTGYRDIRFMPFLILGTIGQVSLVNTFAHIHTPLAVSLLRSFNGLWLGVLGGLVLIVLWRLAVHLWKKYQPIS